MGYRTGALSSFPIGAGIGPDATDEDQQIQSSKSIDIIPNIAELISIWRYTLYLHQEKIEGQIEWVQACNSTICKKKLSVVKT